MRLPDRVKVSYHVPGEAHCHKCGRPAVMRLGRVNEPVFYYCKNHGLERAEGLLGRPLSDFEF